MTLLPLMKLTVFINLSKKEELMFIFPVKESTIDKNGIVHVKKSCQEITDNGRIIAVPKEKINFEDRKLLVK